MLRVPTFLAESPISGLGLFAKADIESGAVIWEFTPGFDAVVVPPLLGVRADFVRRYGYSRDGREFVICIDDARYINHSAEPNTSGKSGKTIAARLIRAGEEITEDYREFEHPARIAAMPFIAA